MSKINVYLPDDLADAVKNAGLPVSAICQRALEQAVRRVTAVREIAAADPAFVVNSAAVVNFTARCVAVLTAAQVEARADGLTAFDSGCVLRAMVSNRDSIAVRVLTALEISPRQVRAELDRRVASGEQTASGERSASASARPEVTPAADVAKALELAANESSALGTTFIGTEHLLLGLIGEPDGVAGHVLRSLGADLRVSRRTVAAALAGWDARAAHQPQREDEASRQADGVAAIVRAELAPVLARIARLESRGTG